MFLMQPLCSLAITALCFTALNAQTVPYTVSTVQGSNIITNYYDPYATTVTGPGMSPSTVVNQFNQPLGKPLDISASTATPFLSSSPLSTPFGSMSTIPSTTIAPINGTATTPYTTTPYATSQYATTTPTYATTPAYATTTPYAATPVETSPTTAFPGTTPVQIQPATAAAATAAISTQPTHFEEPAYTFPGLVARLGRKWVGSDYLYQIPSHIGVVVEVVQPDRSTIKIDSTTLKTQIMNIFSQGGISPQAVSLGNQPPLPFFHVLIFLAETPNHGIAAISGRLFENVILPRFHFELPGTFQAITWEQQDLIVTSHQQINEQVQRTALEIASNFVQKVLYYLDLRVQQESDIKLKGGAVFAPISTGPQVIISEEAAADFGPCGCCQGCRVICR